MADESRTYKQAIEAAVGLIEDGGNVEYVRGITELIADTFGYHGAGDMEEARARIERDIARAWRALMPLAHWGRVADGLSTTITNPESRRGEIAERLTELDGYRDRNGSLSLMDAGECAELGIELARMMLLEVSSDR